MNNGKRLALVLMLLTLAAAACACHENPPQEQLYARLFAHFESFGYACSLQEVEAQRDVPIYQPSVWKKLMLDGEEVLVYFDESNRADYLSAGIDEEAWGYVTRFGLRFVLVYAGDDAGVLKALSAIENE